MIKSLFVVAFIVFIAGGISACASLRTFDAIVPYDSGAQRIAKNISFGDNPRQSLDIYAPADAKKDQALPVIVFIHGGSWASGEKNEYGFVGHALAARGFVTVLPEYRLVPEVVFPEFVRDGAKAMRWVQDNIGQFGGDPKRVVLMGHSAGAYNAMMLALDEQFLRQSGVDARSIKGIVGIAGPYDFFPYDVTSTVNAFGQYPDSAQTQPITFVRANAPAALLLTGDDDTTVKPRNTLSLSQKLKAAGGLVETQSYPGVGHVSILLSLSRLMRGKSPALDDAVGFAQKVTNR